MNFGHVYMVLNYDYANKEDYDDDWDISDYDTLSAVVGLFTNQDAAFDNALDIAKEEADVCGRPYRITFDEDRFADIDEICSAVVLEFLDDSSASVYVVVEREIRDEYEPHMEEDMPLEKED